jgi:hypothetical protein
MRMFGWIDRVEDTCVVATEFVQLAGVPLWPVRSQLIDTSTLQTMRDREERLFATELSEITTFRAVPLGRDRRSILAGYLRAWGVIALVFGAATALQSMTVVYAGTVVLAAGLVARKQSYLKLADQLVLVGLGAMAGIGGELVVSRHVALVIAAAAAGGIAITMQWRRATKERAAHFAKLLGIAPDVIEQRRTLDERAAQPASPALPTARATIASRPSPPITTTAPERVEPATDTPKFLA